MKLTAYDMPIGRARPSTLFNDSPGAAKPQARRTPQSGVAAKCVAAGLSHAAVHTFRHRHPELAHWTDEQVISQCLENRDRRAMARRQLATGGGRFGPVEYEQ